MLAVACWLGSAMPPCAASSLAPASVRSLAGTWQLSAEQPPVPGCTLTLTEEGQASSNGCEAQWLGDATVAWASKPDGMTFANQARQTLMLLTPVGPDHFRGRTRQGRVLWLQREQD
jgi:hypothetical protein